MRKRGVRDSCGYSIISKKKEIDMFTSKRGIALFLSIIMVACGFTSSAYAIKDASSPVHSEGISIDITEEERSNTDKQYDRLRNAFKLGSDSESILYSSGKAAIGETTYSIKDGNLVSSENGNERIITHLGGDNLNILGNDLIFTSFQNNEAHVCAYSLNSGEVSDLLNAGNSEITHMYVVNNNYIEYLASNTIYRYNPKDRTIEKLAAPSDVFSFIPTYGGHIYADGSSVSASIFFENTKLLDDVTYYTIEHDCLIATIEGITYQIPMTDLLAYCNSAKRRLDACGAEFIDLMTVYDFFGTVSIDSILDLDDHQCEQCDEEAENAEPLRATAPTDNGMLALPGTAVPPNACQTTIINRATPVVNFTWTPKVSFDQYTGQSGSNFPDTYIKGEKCNGLPYSRPGKFYGDNDLNQVYVFFGSISTLAECKTLMENINDDFNVAAKKYRGKGYGPLYGLDCGVFVCYAWGLSEKHGTGLFAEDENCVAMTAVAKNSYLTEADLAKLMPGDAFVSASNHAILVTAVHKNSSGKVVAVETMEETPPSAVKKTYVANANSNSISYLLRTKLKPSSSGNPYQIYRYKESVRFNAQGGSVFPVAIRVATGKSYGTFNNNQLPIPSRQGFTFTGWYTAASGETQVTASTIVGNGTSRTLYAHWIDVVVADYINQYGHCLPHKFNELNTIKEGL